MTQFVVKPDAGVGELSNRDLDSINLTSRNSKNKITSLLQSGEGVKRQRTESIEEILKSRGFAGQKAA